MPVTTPLLLLVMTIKVSADIARYPWGRRIVFSLQSLLSSINILQ